MSHLCIRRYFKPAEVREENPDLSTLPWPPRPVGPDAHAQNRLIEIDQLRQSGRQKWKGKGEHIFTLIGYTVGLSAIFRFPYFAYRNKGGAFLIPYLVFTVVLALPATFLEIALGQFSGLSMVKVWRLSPLFKGIGYSGMMLNALAMIYYNVIIAWSLVYMFASFTSELPWATCGNFWNTEACSVNNNTAMPPGFVGPMLQRRSPADEFWMNRILRQSSGIEESGTVVWEILLCLILVWLIVFLAISKGIRSVGKLAYVTAILPFLTLAVILIRSFTLPGALTGVGYFFTPDLEALVNPMVWGDAVVCVFFSIGVGSGPLINLGSYGKFHNNCQRDAIIVVVAKTATDLMCGLAVFSIMGFMSQDLQVGIDNVITSGPGVAFVCYSRGVSMLPLSPLWAFIFFLTMFMLGIDSAFGTLQAIVTVLVQEFRCLKDRRIWVAAATCGVIGLTSISLTTQSGMFWVNLMDYHIGRYPLIIIGLLEIIVVMYIYGYTRFADDFYVMLGFYPSWFFVILWNFVTPLTLLGLLIGTIANHQRTYFEDYVYPDWGEMIGWLLAGASVMFIPILMVATIYSVCYKKQEWTFRQLVKPKSSWGPALNVHRDLRGLEPLVGNNYEYATVEQVRQNKMKRRFNFSAPKFNFGRREPRLPSYDSQGAPGDVIVPDVVSVPNRNDVIVIPTNGSSGSSPPAYPGLGRPLYPDLQNTRFSTSDSMTISNPDMFQRDMPSFDPHRKVVLNTPHPQPTKMEPHHQVPQSNAQPNAQVNPQMMPINLNITLVQGNQGDANQGTSQGAQTNQQQFTNTPHQVQLNVPTNQQQGNIPTNQQQYNIPTASNQIPQIQANQPLLISGNQMPTAQQQEVSYPAKQDQQMALMTSHGLAHNQGMTQPISMTSHGHAHHQANNQPISTIQHISQRPVANDNQLVNFSSANREVTPVHQVITAPQIASTPVVPPIVLGDTLPGYRGNSILREIGPAPTTFIYPQEQAFTQHFAGYM